MSRYNAAEYIYTLPDVYTAKILSTAISSLNKLDDRTPLEEEALRHALKLERELQKEPT